MVKTETVLVIFVYNENIIYNYNNLFVKLSKVEGDSSKALLGNHFHSEIELVRCDFGIAVCNIGGERLEIKPGEVILVNSRVMHYNKFLGQHARITYMQIDIDKYAQQLVSPSEHYFYQFMAKRNIGDYKIFSRDSGVRRVFDEIEAEINGESKSFQSFVKANVYYLIAVMSREGLRLDYSTVDNISRLAKIMPAIHYAEEHYKEKIVLDELCREINLDKYYFCKLFSKTVGATYTDFVGYLRLANAENMLLSTDKTVSEIAYDCGFGTLQYFNRVFKERNSCTPSQYRKLNLPLTEIKYL